jgi:hypothetical protein
MMVCRPAAFASCNPKTAFEISLTEKQSLLVYTALMEPIPTLLRAALGFTPIQAPGAHVRCIELTIFADETFAHDHLAKNIAVSDL